LALVVAAGWGRYGTGLFGYGLVLARVTGMGVGGC
jgi:hypothetical protein